MVTGVANGNLDVTLFDDEAVTDATDETVLEMIMNLKDVTDVSTSIEVDWNQELDKIEPVLSREMCGHFAVFLINGIEKPRNDSRFLCLASNN